VELSQQQIIAMKRKRGELNLTIKELSKGIGISRWTIDNIFKRNHTNVNTVTFERINNWLIDEYTKNS
jgi:predicted transcriptional regulator